MLLSQVHPSNLTLIQRDFLAAHPIGEKRQSRMCLGNIYTLADIDWEKQEVYFTCYTKEQSCMFIETWQSLIPITTDEIKAKPVNKRSDAFTSAIAR